MFGFLLTIQYRHRHQLLEHPLPFSNVSLKFPRPRLRASYHHSRLLPCFPRSIFLPAAPEKAKMSTTRKIRSTWHQQRRNPSTFIKTIIVPLSSHLLNHELFRDGWRLRPIDSSSIT